MYWAPQQRWLFPNLQGSLCHLSFCTPFRDFTLQTWALWFSLWGSSWPAGPELYFCLGLMNCPSPCLYSPSFSLCKQLLSPALRRNGAGQQQPHFFLWKSFYHQVWISYSVSLIQQQYKQTVVCNNQPQFSCMWWKTLVLETGLWTSVLTLEFKIFLNWENA